MVLALFSKNKNMFSDTTFSMKSNHIVLKYVFCFPTLFLTNESRIFPESRYAAAVRAVILAKILSIYIDAGFL